MTPTRTTNARRSARSTWMTGAADAIRRTKSDHVHQFRLDRETVLAGIADGLSGATILQELTDRARVPLPQNVQTTYVSVDMKYESIRETKTKIFNDDGDEIGKRVFKGYEVSKTVTVRLTDITRFEEFFAEVLKTGLSEVNSVKFETSKLREHKDRARELAVKAAKEKAGAMAAALGQSIGKAIKITEGTVNNPTFTTYAANANSSVAGGTFTASLTTFAPGAIKVEAQVTVSFQLN